MTSLRNVCGDLVTQNQLEERSHQWLSVGQKLYKNQFAPGLHSGPHWGNLQCLVAPYKVGTGCCPLSKAPSRLGPCASQSRPLLCFFRRLCLVKKEIQKTHRNKRKPMVICKNWSYKYVCAYHCYVQLRCSAGQFFWLSAVFGCIKWKWQ